MEAPLHSHNEYEMALRAARCYKNKAYLTGLSEDELKEQKRLNARIYKYRKDALKNKKQ